MRRRWMIACMIGMLLLVSAAYAQAAPPATQPAGSADFVVSDMRVQTIPGFHYLYQSSRTTLADISALANRTIGDMTTAIHDGKFHPNGPLVFVYHDMMDLSKPFNLDIGFVVPEGTRAFGASKVQKTESFKCATVLFSGSLDHLSDAYGKVMAEVGRAGLKPTGTMREFYLYWESPKSPNNVVQIQIGIE